MTQQEIDEAVEDAHRHNFRVAHSRQRRRHHRHGAEGVREGAGEVRRGPIRGIRIEHCSLVNPDLLRRIKALGVIPTPFWTYAHYHGEKWKEYGAEKMQWMFAHKSFLDTGIAGARRVRLRPGTVRAADGASEHGHAQGLQRQRLGRTSRR